MNIGRYEVIEEVGKGGMAIVYLAYDPYIKRQVAVKVLPRQFTYDPEFRVRFQREAQVVAALEHSYVVPIYDFGEHEDQPFLIMRYLPGGTLTSRLQNGAYSIPETVSLFHTISIALDYAHKNGIIHRDIKPGNILFDSEGNANLSDFGIAKIQESSAVFTSTGNLVGTPAYMSPEQAMGEKTIDGRADIYSMGVVLFQCLSGELPFKADTPMGLAIAHIQKPVPSVLPLRPDLPPGFDTILHKALEKTPALRYQSAAELFDAIYQQAKNVETGIRPAESMSYSGTLIKPTLQPHSSSVKPEAEPASAQPSVDATPSSSSKKRSGLGWIAVVVLLLAGLIGGFATGYIPNPFTPAQSTDTASSSVLPTVIIPSATKQPTKTLTPTRTPTDVPTQVPTDTLTPTPSAPQSEIVDAKGISMALVPAGGFLLGGNDIDSEPDEKPAHTVVLDDFYIDIYEVTNVAYQACVTAGVCRSPIQADSFTRSRYYGVPEYNEYPVVYVDWNMAKTYCEWRDARLPTEAEWEKAARGSEDQRFYPWGTPIINCQLANYSGPNGCYGGTTQVGSYEEGKSPYGVYDMAGNVWEWVADWFSETYYKISPTNNPTGPDTGQSRILRGGSWNRREFDVRVSNRNKYAPTYYNFDIGFRCASDVSP